MTETAAAILSTAEQLADPLITISIGSPAANNLQAAAGAADAEAQQGSSAACNSTAVSVVEAGQHLQGASQPVAAASLSGPAPALHRSPLQSSVHTDKSSPRAASSAADGEQHAISAPHMEQVSPPLNCNCLAAEESMDACATAAGVDKTSLSLKNSHDLAPEHTHNALQQPLDRSTGLLQSFTPAASSPPDAQPRPSSGGLDAHPGSSAKLQGVPSPTGSHIRFDSDEEAPCAAEILEDSEVIAQLQFAADERGHVVISFNGRTIQEPPLEDRGDRAGSHARAGPRNQEQPNKAQRQW